ncbi:MAG TPA: hypothetical protein VGC84_14535, partial [Ilumatobacteraceae bacterium]
MTTPTSSNRGARRRNGGRRTGGERSTRAAEPMFSSASVPTPATEAVAPKDYITDFVALGVPAPLIKALADRDVLTAFPI